MCCVAKANLLHTLQYLNCNDEMMDEVHEGDDSYCKSLLLIGIVNRRPKLDKYYLS